ncbi:alpha/beta fold hydrolase [Pseudoalteromonas sp. T1lg65]|uniref:alpha/beta fold hydrolase n=1 Tax=Pseudoalteromonas sp. T1lg65 TaxID=2077101 RepID=UPI003F7B1E46
MLLIFLLPYVALGQPKQAHVNDTSLEYIDVGTGKYTFVLESGVGMGANYWDSLIPVISQMKARVIIYSRAGNGNSSNASDISLESSLIRLNALLESLNVTENLILVGHSFGAFHSRSFANRYADKVAGIVLLDPSHEQFQQQLEALNKQKAVSDNKTLNEMLKNQPEWAILQQIYKGEAFSPSNVTRTFPTVLVTSSKVAESNWWIGHTKAGKNLWRALHQQLISNNPNSIHIVTDSVGHNIPIDDPQLVLQALRLVLILINNE